VIVRRERGGRARARARRVYYCVGRRPRMKYDYRKLREATATTEGDCATRGQERARERRERERDVYYYHVKNNVRLAW